MFNKLDILRSPLKPNINEYEPIGLPFSHNQITSGTMRPSHCRYEVDVELRITAVKLAVVHCVLTTS